MQIFKEMKTLHIDGKAVFQITFEENGKVNKSEMFCIENLKVVSIR